MHPTMLRVKLKCSKTDQFGKGVEVYVGRTGCPLCPVAATLAYMASRADSVIRTLGRWNSVALLVYIQHPVQFSVALVHQ